MGLQRQMGNLVNHATKTNLGKNVRIHVTVRKEKGMY